MGADNWTVCPKCKADADAKKEKAIAKAAKAYGTVPPEEWRKMDEDAHKMIVYRETFREDYEIGIDQEGLFEVTYSGFCNVCGTQHKFSHSGQVKFK